jgi:3-deoxy-D-manno-octulosonic-acid transferase
VLLGLYRLASLAAPPALRLVLARRLARGKEDGARLGERRGEAGSARPTGRLVWLHGASIGEAVSALPLIERLLARDPAGHVLVTTGTVTSARIMAERLPHGARHQFVPVDALPWVARFLDHWRPDAALWIESELWPNLVGETARRGVPMALINARMSDRSFRRWQRWPGLARGLVGGFRLVLAQSERDAERYRALGAGDARAAGNLKFAAQPLAADAAALAALRSALGARPAIVAASFHPGEDAVLAAALTHPAWPRAALAILVPRHPEKAAAMRATLEARGLAVARRSAGEVVAPETRVYLADTLGELGLFYRAGMAAVIGGSFVPHGGQNPLEPALLGKPVVLGPHMDNFAAVAEALLAAGGARRAADGAALALALAELAETDAAARAGAAALAAAEAERGVLDRVMTALEPLLPAKETARAPA